MQCIVVGKLIKELIIMKERTQKVFSETMELLSHEIKIFFHLPVPRITKVG